VWNWSIIFSASPFQLYMLFKFLTPSLFVPIGLITFSKWDEVSPLLLWLFSIADSKKGYFYSFIVAPPSQYFYFIWISYDLIYEYMYIILHMVIIKYYQWLKYILYYIVKHKYISYSIYYILLYKMHIILLDYHLHQYINIYILQGTSGSQL
jgi:hypothetical protein